MFVVLLNNVVKNWKAANISHSMKVKNTSMLRFKIELKVGPMIHVLELSKFPYLYKQNY